MNNGIAIPKLAFGLYKIPVDGEQIILDAIEAGYRHFDTAVYYGNESTLGNAIIMSGLPRSDFFICTKVWNDDQINRTVRESVQGSLKRLKMEYIDLCLIHWPVPGHYIETYKVLQEMVHPQDCGKIRSLGLSNFSPSEYIELMAAGNDITVQPVVNQMEVSPFMYRPDIVDFFQAQGLVVSSSKALHRGEKFDHVVLEQLSQQYHMTPAQLMIQWGLQKGLVVVAKTSHKLRMIENRETFTNNVLQESDVCLLDECTTAEEICLRDELERQRKASM